MDVPSPNIIVSLVTSLNTSKALLPGNVFLLHGLPTACYIRRDVSHCISTPPRSSMAQRKSGDIKKFSGQSTVFTASEEQATTFLIMGLMPQPGYPSMSSISH